MGATTRVEGLFIGKVAPLGADAVPSGIAKRPVTDKLWLSENGLDGDEHGDRRHHGGPDKAVHHYPFDHYAGWRSEIGAHALLDRAPAFGENLSTTGLSEAAVAIGDVFRLGNATIQVSQGRQPCWRLNLRFDVPDMALRVQESGRVGWYYRVLEPGAVSTGDELCLIDRPTPDWTIERLCRLLYVDPMNVDELASLIDLPALPAKLRATAQRRLEDGKVEDWSMRLTG